MQVVRPDLPRAAASGGRATRRRSPRHAAPNSKRSEKRSDEQPSSKAVVPSLCLAPSHLLQAASSCYSSNLSCYAQHRHAVTCNALHADCCMLILDVIPRAGFLWVLIWHVCLAASSEGVRWASWRALTAAASRAMLQQAALEVKTFKKQQSLVQLSPSGEVQAEPAPRWRSVEVWQGGEGVQGCNAGGRARLCWVNVL